MKVEKPREALEEVVQELTPSFLKPYCDSIPRHLHDMLQLYGRQRRSHQVGIR